MMGIRVSENSLPYRIVWCLRHPGVTIYAPTWGETTIIALACQTKATFDIDLGAGAATEAGLKAGENPLQISLSFLGYFVNF